MLNYEYDAEAEKRVLRQESREEGREEGRQEGGNEGIDLVVKFLKDGLTLDEAQNKARKAIMKSNN